MKKKILGLAIFLIGIFTPVFAADVAPLSFTYISQPDTQQAEWDYLMKYKLFGATGIRFKNNTIKIPDSSGWFGTSRGDFDMKGDGGPSNGDILVGGPILIGGSMSLDLGPDSLTSGPVRVTGSVYAPADGFKTRQNYFAGPQCVQGTTDSKYEAFVPVANQHFGSNYGSCPTKVPEIRTRLSIPALTGSHTYQSAIHVDNTTAYIDVPEGEGMYDLYIDKISAQNEGRIYVRMPAGGRLTRIFLNNGIDLGSAHPKLQIQYKQDDGSYKTVNNKDYSGNLLFYTDKDISFASFLSTDTIQGTFITTKSITISHHLTLAGQLLANYILIDTDFDGSGFRYVPFDPPILNIEPQAGTRLEFPENDDLVKVPIALDTAAPVNVYFDYCFDLGNSTAQLSDIYMEDGFLYPKTAGYSFPVCGSSVGKVVINEHMTTPSDKPDESVWINVKRDYAVEGDEPLRLRIMNLTGAVLPGNKHDGYFDLILIDSDIEPKSADFAVTATEDVLFTFESSKFEYSSAFDKAEKGIVIKTLPDKGFLLHNGDTLKAATFPNEGLFIPLSSVVNEELKFIGAKDGYGVNPAYTSFKFVVVDEDSILSKAPYTATVAVSPVNDAPTALNATFTIDENSVAPTKANGKINVDDVDDTEFTYAFDTGDANYTRVSSLYTINASTGEISPKSGATLNYESADSVLTIKVKVTDAASTTGGTGKLTATSTVTIRMIDVNEAPTITDKGPFNVDENSDKNTVVGQVKATDPDTENPQFGTLTFSIDETDVPFVIDSRTGKITVAEGANLDFETKPVWTIHVTVTDGFLSDHAEVIININDLNEPPHIDDIQDEYNVVENTPNTTVFASIKITDQDAADDKDAFTVTLTDLSTTSGVTASQLFKATVVENDDHSLRIVITVIDSDKLDYEALLKNGANDVYYDVRLTLTDHNDNGTQNTVTADTRIYVTDENEKPTAKDGNFTIPENSPANTFVGKVEASDPDTANAAFGTLYYSFVESTDQFVINNTTGEIRVKSGAVLDYETTPNHKITLKVNVTDNTYTETATVVVTLTDMNEPPEIIDDGKDYEVVENTAVGTEIARLEIKDVDAADANFATSLKVSLADNASHALKAEDLFETVVKSEGGKTYAVIQVKSIPNFEEVMNKNAQDSVFNVTITVKDRQGAAGCDSVKLEKKITVRDDNEAPIIAETPIYTVKENSAAGTSVGKVDAFDEDMWSVLTFELVNIPGGDDVASLFNIDNTGKITVAAGANLDYESKNEYRVTVRVTDNGSSKNFTDLSDEAVITIQVTDEDEKPGFDDKYPTFYVYENSKAGTNVGTVTATDDDCKDNTCNALTYTLVADTVAANASDYKEFKIDPATGKITVAKDSTLNYEKDSLYYALVVVNDGALKDTARVTIKIKDANDKPVIENKIVSVPENSKAGTVVDTIPADDEDTWSSLVYSLADVNPNDQVAKLFTVDNNGVIKVAKDSTLDYETRKEYQVWVIVTDNGHDRGFDDLSDSALITINVTDVNEPPEFIDDNKPSYTVAENTATTTEVARYEIKDPDAADANFATTLKVSLADNNAQNDILAESLFNIKVEKRNDTTFAVIRVASVPDFEAIKEANGDTVFNVTLTLKDQNGAAGCNETTLEKKIYVTDVNEKPEVKDAEFAVDENSEKGEVVGTVEATDPDKFNPDFGTLYYSLISSDAATTPGADTLFNIDNNGKITVAENATLNYEETPVIYVKVRVTDNELSDTALVTVNLKDVDENPKIIIDDGPDGEDDSDSLCIAHCDTTDRGHDPDTKETLTVGVKENSSTGTIVFAYVVADEDRDEVLNLTPSLKDNNGTGIDSLFKIEMVTDGGKTKLVVSVLDSAKLDYEKVKPLHEVTVIVTDPMGLQDSIIRKIQVIDVNEAPTVEDAEFVVDENSKKGDSVGVVEASDPDVLNPAFGTLYYSLLESASGADTLFNIDNNGKVTVAENANLNYEQKSEYVVNVRVTDGDLSDTATVTIRLKNVNENPKIIIDDDEDGEDDSDSLCVANCRDTTDRGVDPEGKKTLTVGVSENVPTSTVVVQYVVADEDAGQVDSLTATLLDNKNTGVDSLFTVTVREDPISGKQVVVITVKDSVKLDYEKIKPEHEVSIVVTDPDGLADTLVRVIRVIDVNEPPTFETWPFEFVEHNEPGTVVGHVEHGEDVDTMAVYGPSTPENYIHDKFELTGGADGADTLFKLLPNGDLVALKTFDFETDPHEYVIYISLMDTLMPELVETDTVWITLKDLNEQPKIVTDSVRVEENVPKGTPIDTIKAEDLDLYDTVLTFTLVEDKSGCFEVSERGVVTVKVDNCPDLDYEKNNELPITVKVTDNGTNGSGEEPKSDTKTIIVKITDVNENPEIPDQTITVSEDTKIGTEIGVIEASDPDTSKAYGTLTYELVEESTTFEVKEDGTVILKDSLDYEKDSVYTIKVRVTDGELSDTALVTIKIGNVFETPEVEITRAETVDSTWKSPDTLYINTTDICIDWEARNKKSGAVLKDTTECMLLEEGENVIIKKFEDPTMDEPGFDTLVVYVSKATPIVSIRKVVDDADLPNIFTVVQESEKTDTSFYVNDPRNDIVVTVTDPVSGSTESFTTRVELDTVSVPKKTFTSTMAGITDFGLALTDNPASGTSRTPINGEKVAISYTEEVNGHKVTVTYYTDDKGEMIANDQGVVEMTVSYTDTIGGHPVTISYQADAVTGAVIKTTGGYAGRGESSAESSSSGKDGSGTSAGKDEGNSSSSDNSDGKSSSSKKYENEVVFTVSYETVDEAGNVMMVSYGVDAEGNIVRNEDNNIGYLLTYSYKNKFGNTATQSLFIVLDQVPPKVKILYPTEGEVVYSNFVDVKWTVDIGDGRGPIVQDTLITQGLVKGGNPIVRFYRDKAGNEASDTVRIIMKNAKDVDIAIEQPVTEVSKDQVAEYYATHEPEPDQTFAVTLYNPKTDKEVETVIGGSFDNKAGSGDEPYPGLPGHLGPTLGIETKVPTINAVGGLATLDDIVGSDGLVSLEGVDANSGKKATVEEYVRDYCTDEFAENVGSDLSRVNLYRTKMYVKIWIYTTLGDFVDYYSFTQDLDDPDYMSDAGLLTLYFEMKPDRDGNVRTASGRLLGTGAYVYKTEVEMKSILRCSVPPFTENDKGVWGPSKASNEKGSARSVKEDMLKNFGYKRPEKK